MINIDDKLGQLTDELLAWTEGRKSYTNIYAHHERAPEAVAVLDAQEVVRLAAAVGALCALRTAGVIDLEDYGSDGDGGVAFQTDNTRPPEVIS